MAGLRVLELGGGVSAPMAGKLLADLGATVVKIEPPDGEPGRHDGPFRDDKPDPEASGTFLYLNTGKRSLVLELNTPAGRAALADLAARADLLIHDLPPRGMESAGVDWARFSAANPRLVMVSITPFGLSGPYRDYAANELTLIHGGGWGWLCPGKSTPPERPPLKPFGRHALAQTGLHAAVAALGALHGAALTGIGEHIDLSVQEVVTFLLGRHFAVFPFTGRSDSRLSPPAYEPMNLYPCEDGQIFLVCPEQVQFERLVELMGRPAWALEERFASREQREVHTVELRALLSAWTAGWKSEALFHACQRVRVGAAPVFTQAALEGQEHLRTRGYFQTVDHPTAGPVKLPGAPYRMGSPRWALRSPAPALGEANGERARLFPAGAPPEPPHAAGQGGPPGLPLAGLRVLDLSWVWAGPHATLMMAMMGAEVIKVESSDRADLTRRSHLFAAGMPPGLNRCGYFNQVNQGKLGIGINLSTAEGIALVKELARQSDVMISNFGTGVLERLGLGAKVMQAVNPRLVVAMISAFGQTGPCRHYMGYGPLISPLAGVSALTGYAEDGLPQDVGLAYGDPNAGVYTAVAILAALLERLALDQPGAGGEGPAPVIDVSMWETMLATAFDGWMLHALGHPPPRPMGNRDPRHAPHNLYRCAGEDAWVAIAAETQEQWRALCQAIGRPALADDPRFADAPARKKHEDALDGLLGDWCASRERWEITRLLQAAGVPAFPSLDARALAEDPHLEARGVFTHFPHPEVGVRRLMGLPWRFSNRPNGLGKAAPLLGEDTDAVLERLLGLDAAQRADLRARGIVE